MLRFLVRAIHDPQKVSSLATRTVGYMAAAIRRSPADSRTNREKDFLKPSPLPRSQPAPFMGRRGAHWRREKDTGISRPNGWGLPTRRPPPPSFRPPFGQNFRRFEYLIRGPIHGRRARGVGLKGGGRARRCCGERAPGAAALRERRPPPAESRVAAARRHAVGVQGARRVGRLPHAAAALGPLRRHGAGAPRLLPPIVRDPPGRVLRLVLHAARLDADAPLERHRRRERLLPGGVAAAGRRGVVTRHLLRLRPDGERGGDDRLLAA